jgi:uncharacterized protein (DUF2147 family)
MAWTAPAPCAEPTGEWLVADSSARIWIEKCGEQYWGIVAWEKAPGQDTENPDPAKRGQPTLGLPVLLGMKPVETDQWEGEVYNAKNGKTYSARLLLQDADSLKVEGCLIGGFLCLGEVWTRIVQNRRPAGSAANICSRLNLPGPPHQGRLEQNSGRHRANQR